MGRKSDAAIMDGLTKRLDGPEKPIAALRDPEPAPSPKKPSARDGMKFVGFYCDEALSERLRTYAFESRKEKQVIMRDALDAWLRKHDS